MKTKTLLIAAVMFLGISVAAFAQAQYSVSASPETTRVSTGYTEKVGDIGFNTIQASDLTVTGTITIEYGRDITTYPLSNIQIETFVNAGDNVGYGVTPPTFVVAVEDTQVIIEITPAAADAARIYSFRLTGVRVDVHGGSGNAPIDAVVTATQNMIVNGQATARVLNAIELPFASFTNNTVAISALDGGNGVVTFTATEKFRAALGVTVATDDTQNNVQLLKIVLDNAVPAGVTVTFDGTDSSGNWALATGYDGILTSADGAVPTVVYQLVQDTNVAEIEAVKFRATVVAVAPTSTVYDTDYAVKAKITLAPIHDGTISVVPRYAESYLESDAVFTFFAAFDKTVLMIPYATTAALYDTGIAISNTTLDPGAAATDFISPLQQDGKITFYFFPNDGDPFAVDTIADYAALPAQDPVVIGADGLLPAGKTYVVLLSQLLAAVDTEVYDAPEDPFTGYIIAVCDFTHAHGQYFISDFGDFTNGALMLVMNPASASRATSVPESFGN